jgi:hypothetical protein
MVTLGAATARAQEGAAGQTAAPKASQLSPLTVVAPAKPAGFADLKSRTFPTLFRQSFAFVAKHGATTRALAQFARWTNPICPKTLGLSEAGNARVTQRIRMAATQAGAPVVSGDRCAPNIEVVFVSEPQALIDEVAKRSPVLLGYHYVAETRQVSRITHPIQAWYLTKTQAGGVREQVDEAGRPSDISGCPPTAFTICLKSAFANILILVDIAKVQSREIDQVGDYVADLALVQPLLANDCSGFASILDVMADNCAEANKPQGLTDFDIAYMRSLYQTNLSLYGYLTKTEIASHMARMIRSDSLAAR